MQNTPSPTEIVINGTAMLSLIETTLRHVNTDDLTKRNSAADFADWLKRGFACSLVINGPPVLLQKLQLRYAL